MIRSVLVTPCTRTAVTSTTTIILTIIFAKHWYVVIMFTARILNRTAPPMHSKEYPACGHLGLTRRDSYGRWLAKEVRTRDSSSGTSSSRSESSPYNIWTQKEFIIIFIVIMIGTHETVFSDKLRNVRFIFDCNLTVKQRVIKICQTAYYELKRVSSISRYLTDDATKQLVTSCVLSRWD